MIRGKYKNTLHITILYSIIIISIVSNILLNKNISLENKTKILKTMDEATEVANLNKTIDDLNGSHTEYQNYIKISKQKIANAINMYPNNNATNNNSLEELSTMVTNLTNIAENKYYYESGTEGDESTIVRYKKIGEEYYICDEHGTVATDTTATDVSSLTLVPYNAITSKNLSAGSAGYASGKFYLGDGSDNEVYYELGCDDGDIKHTLKAYVWMTVANDNTSMRHVNVSLIVDGKTVSTKSAVLRFYSGSSCSTSESGYTGEISF